MTCGAPAWRGSMATVEAARKPSAFTPDGLKKAEEALRAAHAEIEAQNAKTFPSYGRAQQLLAEPIQAAQSTKLAGEARARALAELLLPKVAKALAKARVRLQRGDLGITARSGDPGFDQQIFALLHREASGGREGMTIKLDELGGLVEDARQAIAAGDPMRAYDRAAAVRQDLERCYPGITGQP